MRYFNKISITILILIFVSLIKVSANDIPYYCYPSYNEPLTINQLEKCLSYEQNQESYIYDESTGKYYKYIEIEADYLWLSSPSVSSSYIPSEYRSQAFIRFNESLNDLIEVEFIYTEQVNVWFVNWKGNEKHITITDTGTIFGELIVDTADIQATGGYSMYYKFYKDKINISNYDYMINLPVYDVSVWEDEVFIIRLKYDVTAYVQNEDGTLEEDGTVIIDDELETPYRLVDKNEHDFDNEDTLSWISDVTGLSNITGLSDIGNLLKDSKLLTTVLIILVVIVGFRIIVSMLFKEVIEIIKFIISTLFETLIIFIKFVIVTIFSVFPKSTRKS